MQNINDMSIIVVYILKDFGNAPFYIHCLFHMAGLRMFPLPFYPLAQWPMICHKLYLLMLFLR